MEHYKMPFGKYKGRTLSYIYKKDLKYLEWVETIANKDPLKSELEKFYDELAFDESKMVDDLIKEVDKRVIDGELVYYIDIHAVGTEFIIFGGKSNKKSIYTEEVMGEQYSINGQKVIDKTNYDKLYTHLEKINKKQGCPHQKRGLY